MPPVTGPQSQNSCYVLTVSKCLRVSAVKFLLFLPDTPEVYTKDMQATERDSLRQRRWLPGTGAFSMVDDNVNFRQTSADIIPLAIRRLEKLQMGPPPRQLFDDPLGCPGARRLIALYWMRAIGAPILIDGFLERVGNPEPYRIWRHHPHVMPYLLSFNLGDVAERAEHWLLLDRLSRLLYVGRAARVRDVLEYQRGGIVEPLPDVPSESGGAEPLQLMGKTLRDSQRKLAKLLVPGSAGLHALEAWLNENVA